MAKIGIALGGGGITGCAHLGVLKALEEEKIPIYCLTGTSSGALVAALYACGYTVSQLIQMVPMLNKRQLDIDYWSLLGSFFNRSHKMQGVLKGKKFRELFASRTAAQMMADLKFPVTLIATDLMQARPTVLTSVPSLYAGSDYDVVSDMEVADAILASCSIPVLFQPIFFGNRVLVDGGLIDNCPISHARTLGADIVIAVNLCSTGVLTRQPVSLKAMLTQVITVALVEQSKRLTGAAEIVLCPSVNGISPLDFSKSSACIEEGYAYTYKHMKRIRAAIDTEQTELPVPLPRFSAFTDPSMEDLLHI